MKKFELNPGYTLTINFKPRKYYRIVEIMTPGKWCCPTDKSEVLCEWSTDAGTFFRIKVDPKKSMVQFRTKNPDFLAATHVDVVTLFMGCNEFVDAICNSN